MPWWRRLREDLIPSHPAIDLSHPAVEAVWHGESDTLRLYDLAEVASAAGPKRITELPDVVRQLSGLRRLDLGASGISQLPPWLVELRGLELIDARSCELVEVPRLPRTRWLLRADTVLSCQTWIPPAAVDSVVIDDRSSSRAHADTSSSSGDVVASFKLSELSVAGATAAVDDLGAIIEAQPGLTALLLRACAELSQCGSGVSRVGCRV